MSLNVYNVYLRGPPAVRDIHFIVMYQVADLPAKTTSVFIWGNLCIFLDGLIRLFIQNTKITRV